MYRRKLNRILLVITGLLVVCGGYAQDPTISTDEYNDLGNINTPIGSGDAVCPSFDVGGSSQVLSIDTFKVLAAKTDVGDTWFEWVVYGGTIVYDNGNTTPVNSASTDNYNGVPYFYISNDNYSITNDSSVIAVQWHNDNLLDSAWVAVRQISQWGCTDSSWSVYTQQIINLKPELNFPADSNILMGYHQRIGFALPLPTHYYDEGCPNPLTLSYTIDLPSSSDISGVYDSDNDVSSRTVTLDVGENLVTWTASDGALDSSLTFLITVDDSLSINHIAWSNPTCFESDDGRIYVHDVNVTDQLDASDISYNFFGGTPTQNNNLFSGLGSGTTYGVQVVANYIDDFDWDGDDETHTEQSDTYEITLVDPAELPVNVDDIPSQNSSSEPSDYDEGLTVTTTSCSDTDDALIIVDEDYLTPNNNSLSFDGSNYMPLNLSYLDSIEQISVAAWIKTTSNNSGAIISFDNMNYFQLRVAIGAGDCPVYFQTPAGQVSSNVPVNDGQWHFVVGVYDGVNGQMKVFVDGDSTFISTEGKNKIGSEVLERYGYIGRKSNSETFNNTTSSTYYIGQMAEVAIFDNVALDSTAIDGFRRNGISGATHRWILSENPDSLSNDDEFSDLLNIANNEDYWARFESVPVQVENDAPLLFDWSTPGALPIPSVQDLALGNYTLFVRDNLNCGVVDESYSIYSGDNDDPTFLWNSALFGIASQSDTLTPPALAVDGSLVMTGSSSTSATAGAWWQVDMGGLKTIHIIRLYTPVNITNFDVAYSQNGVDFKTVETYTGTASNYFEFVVNGTTGRIAGYVRITSTDASALQFNEVEVWTGDLPVSRTFYLGDPECAYTIDDTEDGTINPMAWDICGSASGYYLDGGEQTSVHDMVLSVGQPQTIRWYAEDNNQPDSNIDSVDVVYYLLDTIPPHFIDVLPNDTTVITYCDAESYKIPLPDAGDNYNCNSSDSLQTLRIRIGSFDSTYVYHEDIDPVNTDSITIPHTNLSQGHRNIIWTLTDLSGNSISDTTRLYVQEEPFINRLSFADISCNGRNDGQIIIWRITKDDMEDEVTYWLNDGTNKVSYNDLSVNGLSEGSYQVTIEVNGCESDPYHGGNISIDNPPVMDIVPAFTEPECFGDNTGRIDLTTLGGDSKGVLHFPGDQSLSVDYSTLDSVTTDGTVEAWFYLDTLGVGLNDNAAIVSKGDNDYILQLSDSKLVFRVNNGNDITTAGTGTYIELTDFNVQDKTWYHVAATWSSSGFVNMYVHNAEGLITSKQDRDIDSGITAANTGGGIQLGGGLGADNFLGFLRGIRVWKRELKEEEIFMNLRLDAVADTGATSYCVANFFMSTLSSSVLVNNNGTSINNIPTDYIWQDNAYHWIDYPYTNNYLDYKDLLVSGDYTIASNDINGCPAVQEVIHLGIDDSIPPVIKFFDGYGDEELYSTITRKSDTISRFEPATTVNEAGDCWFMAFGGELDPYGGETNPAYADECVIAGMWHNLRGTDAQSNAITDTTTLNNIALSGTTEVTWYVSDGGNIADTTVTYVIEDTEAPKFIDESSFLNFMVYVSDDGNEDCFYTVFDDRFEPEAQDNCGNTRLENDINYTSFLNNEDLPSGTNEVRWIVYDDTGNTDTLYQTIEVIDDIPPRDCENTSITATLNSSGRVTVDAEDLYGALAGADNCDLKNITIATNVALYKDAYQSSDYTGDYSSCSGLPDATKANDGNRDDVFTNCSVSSTDAATGSQWWVNLGASYEIKRIVIYNRNLSELTAEGSTNLTDFTVEILSGSDYATAGVVQTIPYTAGAPEAAYTFPVSGNNGHWVRITSNTADALQLAEVEVYGVPVGESVQNIALDKTATMISSYKTNNPTNCEQNVPASRAVDGYTHGNMFQFPCTVTHTSVYSDNAPGDEDDWEWLQIYLEGSYRIDNIVIWDRKATGPWGLLPEQNLFDFNILLSESEGDFPTYNEYVNGRSGDTQYNNHPSTFWNNFPDVKAYYVQGGDRDSHYSGWNSSVDYGNVVMFNGDPADITDPNQYGTVYMVNQELGDTARYVKFWRDRSYYQLCLAEIQVYGTRVDMPEIYLDCSQLYASPITTIITAEDYAGNETQCDVQVEIIDDLPPVASAKNITVDLQANGLAVIKPEDVEDGSFDNCGIEHYYINQRDSLQIGCDSLNIELTFWYTVVDYAGNRDSIQFDVIVEDNEPPVLECRTDVVELALDQYGNLNINRQLGIDSLTTAAYDNSYECYEEDNGILVFSVSPNTFDCDDIETGLHNVTLTATDRSNQSSTCNVNIAIIDTTPPRVLVRNNPTIVVNGLRQQINPTLIDFGTYDNCSVIDSMWTYPDTIETCEAIPYMPVYLCARDASGNKDSTLAYVDFEPAFEIVQFGTSDCGDYGGTNWEYSLTGEVGDDISDYTFLWEVLPPNETHGHFDNATTSDISNPGYTTPGGSGSKHTCNIRLTVTDSIGCTAVLEQPVSIKPGESSQHYNQIMHFQRTACYGEEKTYAVSRVGASSVTWEINPSDLKIDIGYTPDNIGVSLSVTQDADSSYATLTWNTDPSVNGDYSGLLTCEVVYPNPNNPSKSCRDGYFFHADVRAIPEPTITEEGSGSINIEPCPGAEITYRVNNTTGLDGMYWQWDYVSLTEATLVDGGMPGDTTMTVVWGNTIGATDEIGVTVYNEIGCGQPASTGAITITDNDPPQFVVGASESMLITPNIIVNGSSTQTSCLTVDAGDNVTLSPEITGAGTWQWTGDFTGTSREQSFTAASNTVYTATATFTGSTGFIATQNFNVVVSGTNVAQTFQAEDYDGTGGVYRSTGYIDGVSDNDWIRFDDVNLGDGSNIQFSFRYQCREYHGGNVEIWRDGRNAGAGGTRMGYIYVSQGNVWGWSSWPDWTTTSGSLLTNTASGTHDIYIVFDRTSGSSNWIRMDWFELTLPQVPVCESPALVVNNQAGRCYGWLTSMPIPEAVDYCQGETCSGDECFTLSYEIYDEFSTLVSSGDETDFTLERLDVGIYDIQWTVTDRGGLTNVDPYEYSLEIRDNQAPSFNSYPSDTVLYAGDAGCYMRFDEPTTCTASKLRQVVASDNCGQAVQYKRAIHHDGVVDSTSNWQDYFEMQGNSGCQEGVGIDGYEFYGGGGDYTIIYYARDAAGNVRATPPFTVTVLDNTKPTITTEGSDTYFRDITYENDTDSCNAQVLDADIVKPALSTDTSPLVEWATDNCNSAEELTVTARRSDYPTITYANEAINDNPFPVGSTTVTWFITDQSGNAFSKEQRVIVTDTQAPEMTFDPALTDLNFTYCQKDTIRLDIPELTDNCVNIDSLRVNVWGINATTYNYTQKYNGIPATQRTDILPNFGTGDYRVEWTVWGSGYSRTSSTYDIRVQVQPLINVVISENTSCPGVNDGVIDITSIQYETGEEVLYTIYQNTGYQSGHRFEDLAYGTYNYTHIVVDGCKSPYKPVTLAQNPPYNITGVVTNVWCAEGNDGQIVITTTGGYFAVDDNPEFEWWMGPLDTGTRLQDGDEGGRIQIYVDGDKKGHIEGLEVGSYSVRYTQPGGGGCTATSSFAVFAEDNLIPTIDVFDTDRVVYTDDDDCVHTITAAEATPPSWGTEYTSEHILPSVADFCQSGNPDCTPGCSFEMFYKIESDFVTTGWLTASELENFELDYGENTISTRIIQNEYTYEPYQYKIIVEDNVNPTPQAQSVSGVLTDPVGGNGVVQIVADDLDYNSYDNCDDNSDLTFDVSTDSITWGASVTFDCSAVGKDTTVYFRATDQSDNSAAVKQTGITITDVSAPHIIKENEERAVCAKYPATVTYTNDLGDFTLTAGTDYYDNCGVQTIEYRVVHENLGIISIGDTDDPSGSIPYSSGWTTGHASNPGNAAYQRIDDPDPEETGALKMNFYEGKNYIEFRLTDASGNISDVVTTYTVIVYPYPTPGDIEGD